jgi:hypothetical protein
MVKTSNDGRFFDFVKNLQFWVLNFFMDKEPLIIILKRKRKTGSKFF